MALLTFRISVTNICGMEEIKLRQYLQTHSQKEAADALGVNQSAISQMVKSGRDVRLILDKTGAVTESFELKPIGRSGIQAA